MKIKTSLLALAAVGAFSSVASANMENPMYMPKAGGFYSKTDLYYNTEAESSVMGEEFGYGISDKFAMYGRFGTSMYDSARSELYNFETEVGGDIAFGGRFRAMDNNGLKVDVLGEFTADLDILDNGEAGQHIIKVGARVGKDMDKMTLAGEANIAYALEGDAASSLMFVNLGFNGQYRIDDKMSINGRLSYGYESEVIEDTYYTEVLGQFNYQVVENFMASGYVAYETESEETTVGFRAGLEF